MGMPRRTTWSRALAAAVLAGAFSAHAQLIPGYSDDVRKYDPRDLALLPAYCAYTQEFRERLPEGNKVERDKVEQWSATLGPAFNALHHYCWGLMKVNRALLLARSEQVKRHYLNDALIEFDYVISHSPKDFVLLPEIFARRGDAHFRLGQRGLGLESVEQAVKLKPDYWPPYAFASDHFRATGDDLQARQWLERGLQHVQDQTALKLRLEALSATSATQKARSPR
jgi:tetratricopeptide (TPR) repeat protein